MNGRFQMQGGKYWILPKEMNANRLFWDSHTVIRFVCVSAKFSTCTVVSVNGTFVEDKMRRFKGECAHFSCNNCSIDTYDGASAKFSTNSHETDYSALAGNLVKSLISLYGTEWRDRCYGLRS